MMLITCAALMLQGLPSGAQELLWQTLMDSANASMSQRDYKKAESQFAAALKALESNGEKSDKATQKQNAQRFRLTLRKLAEAYEAQAQCAQAETILHKLIEIDNKENVSKSEFAHDLNILANVQRHLNKNDEAAKNFSLSLAVFKDEIKKHNKEAEALSINTLLSFATLYQDQGKYGEAESLLKQALSDYADSPENIRVIEKLANLYSVQGRFAEAEPLLKKALQVKEGAAGKDKQTSKSLIDLGKVYSQQGKFDQAEQTLKRAIALAEAEAGADSPEVAQAAMSLGDVYRIQDKYTDATSLYEKSQKILEAKFGKQDPKLAAILSKLAETELAVDKYEKAEQLYKAILAIDETTYGAHSRESAKDRSDLALAYVNQGRYQEAEPLYKQALVDVQKAAGPDHPDTATCMNNLAWLYKNEQKLSEAESLLKTALGIRQKVFGNEHPAVARNMANLADIFIARQQWNEAEALLKNAIGIEQRTLEPTHPDIAVNLRALGTIYEAKKDWIEAEATYRKLIALDQKSEVPEAMLASDLDGLTRVLLAIDKKDEAEEVRGRSVVIKSKLPGLVNFNEPVVIDQTGKDQPHSFTSDCPVKDKWALVIGISNFQDPSMNLKYAAKDATDFKNYLVQEAHFQPDHVKLLTDKHATRQNIVDNLGEKWLRRLANPDDLVVIYISSHGSSAKQEAGSSNFIVPYDGNLDNIVFNGIPMQWLTAGIKDMIKCNRIVLVMDVCHGGAVAEGAKGIRRGEIDLNPQKIVTGDGQIVVASSQADQISWESKQYANGVFTRRLLEGLRKNGDKTTLKDAFSYMREKVTEEVLRDRAHFQTPVLVTKWWQGDDIAIGLQPVSPRPGLASAPPAVTAVSQPAQNDSKQLKPRTK
jgi:tetratricopeptide (TPR) repeat protein